MYHKSTVPRELTITLRVSRPNGLERGVLSLIEPDQSIQLDLTRLKIGVLRVEKRVSMK